MARLEDVLAAEPAHEQPHRPHERHGERDGTREGRRHGVGVVVAVVPLGDVDVAQVLERECHGGHEHGDDGEKDVLDHAYAPAPSAGAANLATRRSSTSTVFSRLETGTNSRTEWAL